MRGFTLLEVIIYTALLAMSLAAVAFFVHAALSLRSIGEAEIRLTDARRVVEWHIRERLEEASVVTTPASGSSATLQLNSPTAGEDPVIFALDGTTLTMQLGVSWPIPLTPDDVAVTNFSATRLSGAPASVQIAITYEVTSIRTAVSSTSTISYTLRYE